jgi:hypothetical protein
MHWEQGVKWIAAFAAADDPWNFARQQTANHQDLAVCCRVRFINWRACSGAMHTTPQCLNFQARPMLWAKRASSARLRRGF